MDRGPQRLTFYVLATYEIGCFSKWTALPSVKASDTAGDGQGLITRDFSIVAADRGS